METIAYALDEVARRHGARPAFRVKRDGVWQVTSFASYRLEARRVARALIALGVQPGQGVAILGFNSPEWVLADVGAVLAGACPAGIYTTSSPEQVQYVTHHCDATVAFADGPDQARKFLAEKARLPALETIVQWSGKPAGQGVMTFEEFLARGDDSREPELEARIVAQKPDDVCTLIYTSGTTGQPKAVMISQRNLTFVAGASTSVYGLGAGDAGVSYLPLSHIAEQVLTIHSPMTTGQEITFAESIEALGATLTEARPTLFFGVPRVWEKIQAKIEAAGAANPPLKRRIAKWARGLGLQGGYAAQRGDSLPFGYGLANRMVFSKVRERLGLDRAKVCATGAAPIARSTLELFLSLGVPILEVYGMSECTGPATISTPTRYRTGKAGFVLPGAEVKIAEDGEILIRGPHVFKGYLKDAAATKEAIDEDGWLHSGDIGVLDADGFLAITDRKKELLITAGGENVSPQAVEGQLLSIPVVAQAVVVGDRRKHLAALVTLDADRVVAEAAAAGSPARDPASAAACERFRAHLKLQIDQVNTRLARVQTVKTFAILPSELTIAGGELTPTMKLKRRVILAKYAKEIEGLYEPSTPSA
jgi:long-subunit acyl-CoA synthetase (AMP-forming)